MTTRERILTLSDGGHEPHMIAALLDLEISDVAKALAEPGFTPAAPGLSPTTRMLGPYTVGKAGGFLPGVDLGTHVLGVVSEYAIVVTAFNGDEPEAGAQFNIDFDGSFDDVTWIYPGSTGPAPIGPQPGGFHTEPAPGEAGLPGTLHGHLLVPRFMRLHHEMERVGAAASATFHVDLTYF